jgi:hypothetical protein
MKSVSDVIHATPWWALLLGALAVLVGLAAFVTPYHIIDYRRDAADPAQERAIKREIDNAFAEGAINVARNVIQQMRRGTSDPQRREELDVALRELDQARNELREAGREVLRAKREAAESVSGAIRDATRAIQEAQRDAARALEDAGVPPEDVNRALGDSLEAARRAEAEARQAIDAATPPAPAVPAEAEAEAQPQPQARAQPAAPPKRRITIEVPGRGKLLDVEVPDKPGVTVLGPGALAPEVRERIRSDVTRDLYRIGVGAGLILLFIPLLVLMVVSKFFIDRSRAAQRVAELKRKEAEYHRMSQQVTEAKLSALQAQVEPHFLYNTLASVQALTEVDPARASEMTGHLIQYLRNALPKMRESVSTVGQEVELVRAYLNILQMRMGRRLAFEIAVPEALLEAPFPPLMLPSLVENAIKHGLEPQREGGEVRIEAQESGGRLRMIVSDTGRGFSETPGAGVGLANIRERLAAMYGSDAKLTLEAREPHGVVATIEVPRSGARAGAGAAAATAAPAAPLSAAGAPPAAEAPPTATRKTLRAVGTAERWWRKGLSFAFVGLVVLAGVLAGVGIVALNMGLLPVHFGEDAVGGPLGAAIGTAGIVLAFCVVVLVLAILAAVLYGLGFVMAAVVVFVAVAVVIGLMPVLAPVILVGLGIWWLVRRRRAKAAPVQSPHAHVDPR